MNVIQVARDLLALLPATIEAVRAIEAAIPEGGKGKEKLELVKVSLQAAYSVGGAAVDSFAAVWPAIEKMVGAVVDLFNKLGKFKSTSAPGS